MKRILFVDDDRSVLEALERVLRRQRREWDMHFAGSGEEALSILESAPFDVVVSDMSMSGMDGLQLLGEVRTRHPGAIRLVLTGMTQPDRLMRSASVAHQLLTKPCKVEDLRAAIHRASALTERLAGEALKRALVGVGELPALPQVCRDLDAALAKNEPEMREVAEIIERDPAIAVRVLQVANSSLFGVRREIADIRHAVSYLGTNMIRSLVLMLGAFDRFASQDAGVSKAIRAVRQHSLLTGTLARQLLDGSKERERAFLAGILHDVGRLVLAVREGQRPTKQPCEMPQEEGPAVVAEMKALGISHAEVGAYLLELWGIPFPIVEAVAFHHHPSHPVPNGLGVLGAVHVADCLVNDLGTPGSAETELDGIYLESPTAESDLRSWRTLAAEVAAQGTPA